jgi:hypothetical protein
MFLHQSLGEEMNNSEIVIETNKMLDNYYLQKKLQSYFSNGTFSATFVIRDMTAKTIKIHAPEFLNIPDHEHEL